jgi:hypothetical protein
MAASGAATALPLSSGCDDASLRTICRAYADQHSDDPNELLLSPAAVQALVADFQLAQPKKVAPSHFFSYFEATDFAPYDAQKWRTERKFASRGVVPMPALGRCCVVLCCAFAVRPAWLVSHVCNVL